MAQTPYTSAFEHCHVNRLIVFAKNKRNGDFTTSISSYGQRVRNEKGMQSMHYTTLHPSKILIVYELMLDSIIYLRGHPRL
jgi:hypothetical protein